MKNISWKVECCAECHNLTVKSADGFWGCLKCRELAPDALSLYLEGKCVYCRQPLIPLMEACLSCGNQPKYLLAQSKSR